MSALCRASGSRTSFETKYPRSSNSLSSAMDRYSPQNCGDLRVIQCLTTTPDRLYLQLVPLRDSPKPQETRSPVPCSFTFTLGSFAMNIVSGSGRLTGRLALSLALIVLNSTQIILLAGSNRAAGALTAQKQSASSPTDRRATQKNQQSDDKD